MYGRCHHIFSHIISNESIAYVQHKLISLKGCFYYVCHDLIPEQRYLINISKLCMSEENRCGIRPIWIFSDNEMNGILDMISVEGSNNNIFYYLGNDKTKCKRENDTNKVVIKSVLLPRYQSQGILFYYIVS